MKSRMWLRLCVEKSTIELPKKFEQNEEKKHNREQREQTKKENEKQKGEKKDAMRLHTHC